VGEKANRGHLQTELELRYRHVRRLRQLQVLLAVPVLPAAAVAAVVLPVVLRDPPLRSETYGFIEQWEKVITNFAIFKNLND
jgi:hypothetical protein